MVAGTSGIAARETSVLSGFQARCPLQPLSTEKQRVGPAAGPGHKQETRAGFVTLSL